MADTKPNPQRVVTGKVRFSYVNLFKTRKDETTGRETYSVLILIPKTDTKTVSLINAAVESVKVDPKSQTVWGSKFLASFKLPLRDGDTERDTETSPEYKGHWFMNCNTTQKPEVVDADVQAIISEADVYSGCYGRVSVNFYAYKQNGGIGIAAGLNNAQKLADGEPLGNRSRAEDDFGPASDDDFLG